jgi:lipoprotein-anchoring transpeptidase ErfK/SrfK
MGKPGSRGCIRMHNRDIVELFNLVPVRTVVEIEE